MRLLVLGGTRFVGRALVGEAVARGWDVTAVHRGVTGSTPPPVTTRVADRTDEGALAAALGDGTWDAVVDTWDAAPRVAGLSARLLDGRVEAYGLVSSLSVYAWGRHVDEGSPLVAGDAGADATEYPADKRGGELAVLAYHPDALLARAGMVLGPHEDVGRLPWWLSRIARGGRVVAPGRPDRPLQYVDARDLACLMLDGVAAGEGGAVDVTCPPGHTTTRSLLQACVDATRSDAELVWVDEADVLAAGAEPWVQLPCWVPERGGYEGFMEGDVRVALGRGLDCRPVGETVGDTWRWLQSAGVPSPLPGRPLLGLPAEIEAQLLRTVGG